MKTVEQFIQEYVDSAWELDELPIVTEDEAKLLNNFNTFLSLLQTLISNDELEEGSVQRRALLRLFEISTQALHIQVRNQEENGEQICDIITTIFEHCINHEENNSNLYWPIISILSEFGFKLSEQLMESLFSHQVNEDQDLSPEEQFESAVHAMKLALKDANIDSDIGFYELYKSEFSLLPEGAEEFIFSLLSHQGKSWTIDAILLFLLHPDDTVKTAVLKMVADIPTAELANKSRLARLVCIRNFLSEDNKKALDPVIRSVLKSNQDWQASAPQAQVKEIYCSISDNLGAHSLLVLCDGFIWGGILKQSLGLIDDFYIADISDEQQQDIVQRMSEQFPIYHVSKEFLVEVLPWFIAKSTDHAGISPHGLLFLEKMPAYFSQPQPMSIELRLSTLNTTKSKTPKQNSHLLLDDFPSIRSWIMPEQCQGYNNEQEVLTNVVAANHLEWAERLLIVSLMAKYASHTLDVFAQYPGQQLTLRTETEQDCLSLAQRILQQDLAQDSLLSNLSNHALQEKSEAPTAQAVCYQLKISLHEASPQIWRRLKVSSQTRLDELHLILQIAMGWENMHLYQFHYQGQTFEPQHYDPSEFKPPALDTANITIGELLTLEGEELHYLYDFGDNWEHMVELEKIGKKDILIPTVTTGKNACPPEDCGGVWQYKDLCRILKKPNDPNYEQTIDWLGPFDPKAFNKSFINKELAQFFCDE